MMVELHGPVPDFVDGIISDPRTQVGAMCRRTELAVSTLHYCFECNDGCDPERIEPCSFRKFGPTGRSWDEARSLASVVTIQRSREGTRRAANRHVDAAHPRQARKRDV